MVGNSDTRTPSALSAFTTVARSDAASGDVTFRSTSHARGRYVLLWFTKLAPGPGAKQYQADIFNIVARGTG
jgi:hypothetical protein